MDIMVSLRTIGQESPCCLFAKTAMRAPLQPVKPCPLNVHRTCGFENKALTVCCIDKDKPILQTRTAAFLSVRTSSVVSPKNAAAFKTVFGLCLRLITAFSSSWSYRDLDSTIRPSAMCPSAMFLGGPIPSRHVFAINLMAWVAFLGMCFADYQTSRSYSRSSMSCRSTFLRRHDRRRSLTGMPLRSSELAYRR